MRKLLFHLSLISLIAACSASTQKTGPTGADPASPDSVAKLDPETRNKLSHLMAADKNLLPVQVAGASCSDGDRAACTCGVRMVGMQSCSGGKFERCACADSGLAVLMGGSGFGGAAGAGMMGGAGSGTAGAGASNAGTAGSDGGSPDASTTVDAGPQPRFIDNGDGTVSDMTTGLLWAQANGPVITEAQASSGLTIGTLYPGSHLQASEYCASLSLNGTGWRLPTLSELTSIQDLNFNPTLDPVFLKLPSMYCNSTYNTGCRLWTSTNGTQLNNTCDPNSFVAVGMYSQTAAGVNNGQPYTQPSNCFSSNGFLARCVR